MAIELLDKLFGGVIPEAVKPAFKLLDKAFHTEQEREEAKNELLREEHARQERERDRLAQGDKNQTEINKEEAKSKRFAIAGWRPSMGWACVISIGGWAFGTLLLGGIAVFMVFYDKSQLETVNYANQVWTDYTRPVKEEMLKLIGAMLGMTIYRTYEKIKGLTR